MAKKPKRGGKYKKGKASGGFFGRENRSKVKKHLQSWRRNMEAMS